MNLANINAESLGKELEVEVPDVYVVIAKHQVSGLDSEAIAEIIGCDAAEIEEVIQEDLYKQVRQNIGAKVALMQADHGLTLESIESTALRKLAERVEHERDTDMLLKIASTVNRMERRTRVNEHTLNPASGAGRAAVVLTRRMVEKITAGGHRSVSTEDSISISDTRIKRPSFDEVSALLGVNKGLIPDGLKAQEEGITLEQLDQQMIDKEG